MELFATTRRQAGHSRRRIATALGTAGVLAAAVVLTVSQPASAGIVPTVQLATAADYSVLGATTVTARAATTATTSSPARPMTHHRRRGVAGPCGTV